MLLFKLFIFDHQQSLFVDPGRASAPRAKERVPTRLTLSTRGAEAGTTEMGTTDGRVSDRLATPTSGGRMSFKGSGLPVPVSSANDNAKLRRIMQEGRGQGGQYKQRAT